MNRKQEDILLQHFNEAAALYGNRVCRFIDKLIDDKSFAKDLTQEAYIKLWHNREHIDFTKARAWLFTTAYRLAIDLLRKKKREFTDEKYLEPSSELANPDITELITTSLSQLSEIQKSILLLRDYEGYHYQEISEILEITEEQVKVYLFRARKKMRAYIGTIEKVL